MLACLCAKTKSFHDGSTTKQLEFWHSDIIIPMASNSNAKGLTSSHYQAMRWERVAWTDETTSLPHYCVFYSSATPTCHTMIQNHLIISQNYNITWGYCCQEEGQPVINSKCSHIFPLALWDFYGCFKKIHVFLYLYLLIILSTLYSLILLTIRSHSMTN